METLNIKGKNFELQDIKEITIEDYSGYIPGKSSNGGGYITGVTFTDDGNSWMSYLIMNILKAIFQRL